MSVPSWVIIPLPQEVPRGRGDFRGDGNIRGGGDGDQGQGRGRSGRGGGQNLNVNHGANAPHATPNTNQQAARVSSRGQGAGPNAPQPFNTRGGSGGTLNRGQSGSRGGYNQTNVGIQSLGEGNLHLRKIKFVKSSVVLFHDQEGIFEAEIAEIDADYPESSLATADQVYAVLHHNEESSGGAAGDISFGTPLLEDEKEDEDQEDNGEDVDEEEDVDELAEAVVTRGVDFSQNVAPIGSSRLQTAKSVEAIAFATIAMMETTAMTFAPPADLSDLLPPRLPVASLDVEVVKDNRDENGEDEPSSEEDVKNDPQGVDKGKQPTLEGEHVIDMQVEDDGDEGEELDCDDLWQGFFSANKKIAVGGGRRVNLIRTKTVKNTTEFAPKSAPPEPQAPWTQDRKKEAANGQWMIEDRDKRLADAVAAGLKGKKSHVGKFAAIIKEFVEDDQKNTLKMSAMSKPDQKRVHKIAAAYKLNSVTNGMGKGSYRPMTLTKTQKTSEPLNATLPGRGAHPVAKSTADGGLRKARHLEGDIVGQHAGKIDEGNVGYRLLQTMGWSAGDKIGVTGGLDAPLAAVFKVTKLGLGAAK